MLSSYPESPLTPSISNNFGLNANNSPFAAYQSKFNHCSPQPNQYQQHQQRTLELPRLQNLQISPNNLNLFQATPKPNENNYLALNAMPTFPLPPKPSAPPSVAPSFTRGASVSPNKSAPSANTSGYDSFSSSTASLEQLYAPYQQNMQAANASGMSASHFSPENHAFMSSSSSNTSRQMNDSFTFNNECRTPTPAAYELANLRLTVSVANNNK